MSTACFHAQQVVEKALKSVLTHHGILFKRTHDLVELYSLLEQHSVEIPFEQDLLERLNPYAVTFRYDDAEIELVERKEVGQFVNLIYAWAKKQIR
ncbi:MAG: HEPN domain-containing protein [Gammaproteobacteria bacterium]|nr:HEPN domain-containing protein [Gammaproteobacteria bacterium]